MSRIVFSLIVCLGVIGIIEAAGFGKPVELHVYRLSVSPNGDRLQREPIRDGQSVTLRADDGDSLDLELDARKMQTAGVLRITGHGGQPMLGFPGRNIALSGGPNGAAGPDGGWEYRAIWRTDGSRPALPLYTEDNAVTIESVTFSPVSVLRTPSTTFTGLLLFLASLLLLAPLIVRTRRVSPTFELFVLTGFSAVWIATTGVASTLAIGAFLAIGYFLVRLELRQKATRSSILLVTIVFVVLVLFYFKVLAPYASVVFGQTSPLALPLGLSYFAIRLIDIMFAARARTLKAVNAAEFFGFMLHPSMLAAGPLTTIADFRRARIADWSITDYAAGIARCLLGLAKKLCADLLLAPAVLGLTQATALHPETTHALIVWPMLFGQLLYIYLDFTGYTDIALGTGRALGWRLPENFNWPLVRSNLRRYWQSWHMTLSNWVMRRVYFPAFIESRSPFLAGICAMLTIGIWHQPNFGWTAWALHHGIGLGATIKFLDMAFRKGSALARFASLPAGRIATQLAGWALTMSWVALGMSYTLFDNYRLAFAALRGAFR